MDKVSIAKIILIDLFLTISIKLIPIILGINHNITIHTIHEPNMSMHRISIVLARFYPDNIPYLRILVTGISKVY